MAGGQRRGIGGLGWLRLLLFLADTIDLNIVASAPSESKHQCQSTQL
jgi:hypothetical protein